MKRGKHSKEHKLKNKKVAFFRTILLIIICICIIQIGKWSFENVKSRKLLKDIQKIEKETNINVEKTNNSEERNIQSEKFQKLKNINSDIFAWLNVPETRN